MLHLKTINLVTIKFLVVIINLRSTQYISNGGLNTHLHDTYLINIQSIRGITILIQLKDSLIITIIFLFQYFYFNNVYEKLVQYYKELDPPTN